MVGGAIYAAMDIGGTNTVIGLLDERFGVLAKTVLPTPKPGRPSAREERGMFLDRLAEEVMRLGRENNCEQRIRCLGIGVPGNVDPFRGIVRDAVNLGWDEVHLASEMSGRLGLPVAAEHDVRSFVLGEAYAGAGAGCRNLIGLTIGTGIAAGIIVDGTLVRGGSWRAGEIGHDAVDGEQTVCKCGKIGCLETVASATGIERMAREAVLSGKPSSLLRLKGNVTSYDVYRACLEGDEVAAGIFRRAGTALGRKLATLVYALNPEKIVVGGGVAAAGDVLFDSVHGELRRQYPNAQGLTIAAGRLRDSAVLIGAVRSAVTILARKDA